MKVSNLWLLISPNIQNKNTSVCYIVMSRLLIYYIYIMYFCMFMLVNLKITCVSFCISLNMYTYHMVHLAHHLELKQSEKIYVLGSLWSNGKRKGLGRHHISGSIHMSCETKSYFSGYSI